jgi:hypothetical protein
MLAIDLVDFNKYSLEIKNKYFNGYIGNHLRLNNKYFYHLIETYQININYYPIKNWDIFEIGNLEYTKNEIIEIFNICKLIEQEFVIITTESYIKNEVYKIPNKDFFIAFINDYAKITRENVPFFQPMDYLIISEKERKIFFLDDSGVYGCLDFPCIAVTEKKRT